MTAFALKIIASICMLIDHIGAVFPASTPYVFRLIGRIAFPIYAYLIAQGCRYTKNIYKYLLRLGLFALISEIPFDIAFMNYQNDGVLHLNINFFGQTNIFYTLLFGASCIVIYEKLKTKQKPWLALPPLLLIPAFLIPSFMLQGIINWRILLGVGFLTYLATQLWLSHALPEAEINPKSRLPRGILAILLCIPIFLLGSIMGTDYGMYGIIFIFVFYLAKPENRLTRTLAMIAVIFTEYAYPYVQTKFADFGIHLFSLPGQMMFRQESLTVFWFALVAAPLVFVYNGKQGKKVKWGFYIFYPAHIAVLALIWFVVNNPNSIAI